MPLTRACTRLLRLGRLIVLYDANNVTLSATTNLTFLEDVGARFQSYGWQVQRIDGLDPSAVDAALAAARAVEDRPSLIVAHTHIGYGSPHKQDTWHAHGEPLGVEDVRLTKRALGWPGAPAKRRDALRQRRAVTMAHDEADAFVFLGATGDLARRQIFPALQVHVADLETRHLRPGDRADLTFYWPEADRWEGTDFLVCVE